MVYGQTDTLNHTLKGSRSYYCTARVWTAHINLNSWRDVKFYFALERTSKHLEKFWPKVPWGFHVVHPYHVITWGCWRCHGPQLQGSLWSRNSVDPTGPLSWEGKILLLQCLFMKNISTSESCEVSQSTFSLFVHIYTQSIQTWTLF